MKARASIDDRRGGSQESSGGAKWSGNSKRKRNTTRLGGGGLSIKAFVNAKSMNDGKNPALIKKKKELDRNAKFGREYKKLLKQQNRQNKSFPAEETSTEAAGEMNKNKKGSHSLRVLYEKNREEKEKARIEREVMNQKKKEHMEKAIVQRKTTKQKMLKKTARGQPLMKYRIENLLKGIQTAQVLPTVIDAQFHSIPS